jgi:energy-coupling factor transporter ATP-binding protein EcfA2
LFHAGEVTEQDPTINVVDRVERLLQLAERRAALLDIGGLGREADASSSSAPGPRERARALLEHSRSYLLPRARDLDAPLVVVLLGPTGAGKSSLLNTIAGAPVSRPGVLRPTTRNAVVLATPADATALLERGPLAAMPRGRFESKSEGARSGVAVIDAPDIDSIEHDNRLLSDTLLEIADLCVFVTTATRYADRVPWDVLARIEQRGLPVIVVVNRLPAGADAADVLDHVRTLLAGTGLAADIHGARGGSNVEILGVPEGALDREGQSLARDRLQPLLGRIDALAADRNARRALAEQALAGALAGLAPLAGAIADDLERSAAESDRLTAGVDADHADETRMLLDRLGRGNVLREEVVRQWHSFVGADQITRLFSRGIGRIRGAIVAGIRGMPVAPVEIVQTGASDDITALVVSSASEAARRSATRWSGDPVGGPLVAEDTTLWSASPDLADRTRVSLQEWIRTIATDVAGTGAAKKNLARGASLGVNAGAITIMLSVFVHTGGLTGAEVGIAAATAFLNQKLMNAIFGEAAVQEMIERARDGLRRRLAVLLDGEAARFRSLLPDAGEMRALAAELRAQTDTAIAAPDSDPA